LPETVITRAPQAGHLERLLETERRLESVVARAREKAAALTAAAEAEAARRGAAADAEFQAAAVGLAAAIARETEAAAAALEAEAARQVAEWHAVPPERVAAVADRLAARVVTLAGDELR
jgi:hypothetical protein